MALNIEERKIDTITPYENNPRMNDQAVDAVAASIREFGFRTPILCDGHGVIICGHTRLKAAKKLGLASVPVIVADDLSPSKVQALRIADNQLATLASWAPSLLEVEIAALQSADYDLSILGFDEAELSRLLARAGGADDDAEVAPTELETIQPEALKLIEECDRVVLQFSGGKDSTVAINWARGVCEKFGKPLESVFVETGAEFPDLTSHVIRVCEKLGVKLVLLHSRQNIIEYYYGKKVWPDSIFRDCLHKFINDPVNDHVRDCLRPSAIQRFTSPALTTGRFGLRSAIRSSRSERLSSFSCRILRTSCSMEQSCSRANCFRRRESASGRLRTVNVAMRKISSLFCLYYTTGDSSCKHFAVIVTLIKFGFAATQVFLHVCACAMVRIEEGFSHADT